LPTVCVPRLCGVRVAHTMDHMRTLISLPLLMLLCVLSAQSQTIQVISVDATINPATADYISSSITRATEENAECLVIRLNTPGGLLKSTREIVSSLLTARIPVVIYVSPAGGQAASAGVFITMAANIAAMAPGTNIGAAHPVGMQGAEPDSIMNEKITNDAAAFIKSISEKRSRNMRWAENAVRRSVSLTETEALRDSVIDLIAPSLSVLAEQLDGKTVQTEAGPRTLHTRTARIEEREMDWQHKLLDILSDPNIAYIFFLLGMYGLMFELYNPGSVLPGVVGVISMVIALYSLHTLPVNYAGLALIIFGIVLFLLEIKITSYGLLSVGGVISLFIGSVMLFRSPSSLEFVAVSWGVIIPAVVCTTLFFLFAIGMGLRAQRRKPTTGAEGIVGETGKALTDVQTEGQVSVHGEIWTASSDEMIRKNTNVVVTGIDGLKLRVRKT
jgi:membrane-bound serine protease (ClpP class)